MPTNTKVIVKKRRGGKAEGHHGGAWKVAYADFVTAMMAFFLMMWLLNATTVQQKKGLSDYFDSKIPIARMTGGGSGAFGGESLIAAESDGLSGQAGATATSGRALTEGSSTDDPAGATDEAAEHEGLAEVARSIAALAGSGVVSDEVMEHLATALTDEGLVVDIFDTDGEPLFAAGSAEPTPLLRTLLAMVTGLATLVTNDVQITGHTDGVAFTVDGVDANWALSGERAEVARRLLVGAGLSPRRVAAVVGRADTDPMFDDPLDPRNRRVSITLMRGNAGR